MRLKKTTLLLFLLICMFSLTINVKALDNSLDETILNQELEDINFISGNALIMGNITSNLTVDNILSDKMVLDEEFFDKYDINSIYIKNGEEKQNEDAIVISGMVLVFETNEGTTFEYNIQVVGDLNDDGIVNDIDVNTLIDDILNDAESTIINDINNDSNTNVVDVTSVVYSINNGSWGVGNIDGVNISSEITGNDTVYVGDTIEIVYKIKGFNNSLIKGISGVLNYDKNLLELDSVFTESIYGYVNSEGKFIYIFNNNKDEETITLRFNVLSKGNTNISISDTVVSVDGLEIDGNVDNSKSINILEYGKGGDDDSNNSNNTNNTPNNNISSPVVSTVSNSPVLLNNDNYYFSNIVATTISLSSNNYIKSLKIKNYKINFDKEILEYNITVGNKVNSLDLDIILEDSKASYEVFGNKDFKVGKNKVTIEVTAEDGSTRTYVINVDKKKDTTKVKDDDSNISKIVIIILIILIIIGLIYVIFKDDDEEDNKG